jgi:hypothetical protein
MLDVESFACRGWSGNGEVPLTALGQFTTDRHPNPPAEFEAAIPTSDRPQTDVLDGAAAGTGIDNYTQNYICILLISNHVLLVKYMK